MKENLKKLAGYYKPYIGTFILDMIFATIIVIVLTAFSPPRVRKVDVIYLTTRGITSDTAAEIMANIISRINVPI